MMILKKMGIGIGIIGIILFLVMTSLAMYYYPGGDLHNRSTQGYSFYTNFFSDLGRTIALNGQVNLRSHWLFKTALTLTGVSMMCYFATLPFLFSNRKSKILGTIALLLGFAAAWCYIGIAWNPLNGNYWTHRFYVRTGFIVFLLFILFYAWAIRNDATYPNVMARLLHLFGVVLLLQIVIMLFGPRSWQSPDALWLQVVAQKVIVYGEIACMFVQAMGAWFLVSKTTKN